ncbi:MAG: hypothetical protein Q8P01_01395 [bacterium]|nr:hypothetical protein [bacterium]
MELSYGSDRQKDEEEKFFWSIIPYWKIDSANSRRILHSGDPESD